MSVMLSYTINGTVRNSLLDASVNEMHGAESQITEHQVETGPNITDYIRPMPLRLSITGVVTNTPIVQSLQQLIPVTAPKTVQPSDNFTGSVQKTSLFQVNGQQASLLRFDSDFDRVRDIYDDLADATLNGVLFTVYTSLTVYENMAIAHLAVPRDAANGNAIQFTIDMQQIIEVSVQLVNTPAPKIQKISKGHKTTVPATDTQKAQASKSWFASGADSVKSLAAGK